MSEGFSQGCPASPVFAAIVLHVILSEIYPELEKRAAQRKALGDDGDDGLGGLAILMAYVDDVNAMLYHDDVEFFFQQFQALADPLNAILNTDKTRILTTTIGTSLVDKMMKSTSLNTMMKGQILHRTIAKYSMTQVDGMSVPVEVQDSLRILSAPVGSREFCQSFIFKAIQKAEDDANKLLNGLEDLQTIVQLYSVCTAQKVTHLFGVDVYNTPIDKLPRCYYLWESQLTQAFSAMTEKVLANVTNKHCIPVYSQVMTGMSVNEGDLGIQNPRNNAITSYMTTTKQCLQYA